LTVAGPTESPHEATRADSKVALETGKRPAQGTSAVDHRLGGSSGRERTDRVSHPVLVKLGNLDPCRGRERPAPAREVLPRIESILLAAQPLEEAGTIREQPLAFHRRAAARPAVVAVRACRSREPQPRVGTGRQQHGPCHRATWRESRCRRRLQGGVETGKRLVVPPFASERCRKAGKIAGRRRSPPLRVAVARLDVDKQPRERHHILGVVAGDFDER
jgi:hypothetical protein